MGEWKVGIAKDWKQRLNSYQTSDPSRQFKMEYKIRTTHFREIEHSTHEHFENKHEWLQGKLSDIIKFIETEVNTVSA